MSKLNQFVLAIYNKCILFFPGKILLRLQIRDNVEGNAKQIQYSNRKWKPDLKSTKNSVSVYDKTNLSELWQLDILFGEGYSEFKILITFRIFKIKI